MLKKIMFVLLLAFCVYVLISCASTDKAYAALYSNKGSTVRNSHIGSDDLNLQKCSKCSVPGSGLCASCKGTGTIRTLWMIQTCIKCKGTGKCYNCGGTGLCH